MSSFAGNQQVVFIDSRVPDLRDFVEGVDPGTQVFVLDPSSDGIQQIADILAAGHFGGLTSISIVGHVMVQRALNQMRSELESSIDPRQTRTDLALRALQWGARTLMGGSSNPCPSVARSTGT
jgi:Domain of unknown function (DUF4347)